MNNFFKQMQIISQFKSLRIISILIFLGLTLPIGIDSVQSQILDKHKQTKNPNFGSPPTIPTIRRGEHCSALEPQVISPDSSKAISTTNAYPTFLLFVPKTTASEAQFVLKDSNRKVIYDEKFSLSSKKSGIFRLTIPSNRASGELAVGQIYKWEFIIICDPKDRLNNDESIDGKIQRVSISDSTISKLMQGDWQARLASYRSASFEYDALILLDELRRGNPSNRDIIYEWESSLFKYNLGEFKQFPAIEKP
jgi:hypothetical protein